jgi:hypothetical protein
MCALTTAMPPGSSPRKARDLYSAVFSSVSVLVGLREAHLGEDRHVRARLQRDRAAVHPQRALRHLQDAHVHVGAQAGHGAGHADARVVVLHRGEHARARRQQVAHHRDGGRLAHRAGDAHHQPLVARPRGRAEREQRADRVGHLQQRKVRRQSFDRVLHDRARALRVQALQVVVLVPLFGRAAEVLVRGQRAVVRRDEQRRPRPHLQVHRKAHHRLHRPARGRRHQPLAAGDLRELPGRPHRPGFAARARQVDREHRRAGLGQRRRHAGHAQAAPHGKPPRARQLGRAAQAHFELQHVALHLARERRPQAVAVAVDAPGRPAAGRPHPVAGVVVHALAPGRHGLAAHGQRAELQPQVGFDRRIDRPERLDPQQLAAEHLVGRAAHAHQAQRPDLQRRHGRVRGHGIDDPAGPCGAQGRRGGASRRCFGRRRLQRLLRQHLPRGRRQVQHAAALRRRKDLRAQRVALGGEVLARGAGAIAFVGFGETEVHANGRELNPLDAVRMEREREDARVPRIAAHRVEQQVARVMDDRPPAVDLDALQHVRRGAQDGVGARIDDRVAHGDLGARGHGLQVVAPVHRHQHHVGLCACPRDARRERRGPFGGVGQRQVGATRVPGRGREFRLRGIEREQRHAHLAGAGHHRLQRGSRSGPVPAEPMPAASSSVFCSSRACGP